MSRRFFIDSDIFENKLEIAGDIAHHIRNVLKLSPGESIICVKNKKEFVCNIDKIEKSGIILSVTEEINADSENKFSVSLFQGIPKGDKLEFITEKAVEAGAYEIIPVKMARSIAKISENDERKKIDRLQKIALSAAEQSGRLIIPRVGLPQKLKDIDFSRFDLKIVCYEDEEKNSLFSALNSRENPKNIAVVIGPEGGIDKAEIDFLINGGFQAVTLGKRILRCETAGLYTLANINYHYN